MAQQQGPTLSSSSHFASNKTSTSTQIGSHSQSQAHESHDTAAEGSQIHPTPESSIHLRDEVEVEQPQEEEEEEDPILVEAKKRLRTTRSDVWDEFTRVVRLKVAPYGTKDALTEAICNHCNKRINALSAQGTSRLKCHLRSCKLKPENKPGQRKISSIKTGNQPPKLVNWKYDSDATRLLVVKMIAKHDYPLNMVEHGYFRLFVKSLNPAAKMYSRNTTREDVMKVYADLKTDLQDILDDLNSKCSLTTDMWSSKHTKDGYCCVACHYIDDDWKLNKKTLAYILVPSPHTGEVLGEFVKTVTLDWNIDCKLFAVTADNASANNVMMRSLKTWLMGKGCLAIDGVMFHMRCSNHILHLVVLEGMKVASSFITQIRECAKYIKSSQARNERFSNALSQVRLGPKSVSLDVETRWNSTFMMLKNAIHLRQGFDRLAELDPDFSSLPSSEEWQQGILICDCLELFDKISTKFAGIKYPTTNMYYTGVFEVNQGIKEWESSPHVYIKEMGKKMRSKFDSYWSECNLVMSIGVVLDPRYKAKWVEFVYKKLHGVQGYVIEYNKFKTSMNNLYSSYESEIDNAAPDYFSNPANTLGSTSRSNVYDEFMMQNSEVEVQKTELEKYLEEPLLPLGSPQDELRFDILSWWKNHAPKYPTLAKIARDVLAVPVTSVASESMFSAGGRVLTTHRSSLAPECVQALLCISDWLPDLNAADVDAFEQIRAAN